MPTKILIIDHNDSFTYNLTQIFEEMNDVQTNVVPVQELGKEDYSQFDGFVLSPGPSLPTSYPNSFLLLEKYYLKKPFLGVCLGLQIIIEFFKGRLYNLSNVQHGKQVMVFPHFIDDELYYQIPFPFQVGVYHSWAADKQCFPPALNITGCTADGVVMSVRHNHLPIFAVQYHPESYMTQYGKRILENWIAVCRLNMKV